MARNLPQAQIMMLFNGGTHSQTPKTYFPSLNPHVRLKNLKEKRKKIGTGETLEDALFSLPFYNLQWLISILGGKDQNTPRSIKGF